MKKILRVTFLVFLMVSGILMLGSNANAEENPELGDKANSWRYSDGELIDLGSEGKARASAYHPDATLQGIDVSAHKGVIDWEKVKASGIDFAIIRCGYGMDQSDQDDAYFERNASECERLGIPYGVYIYSYATNVDRALSEAEHVLRLVKEHNLSYPVYYDMEDKSTIGSDYAAIAATFCNRIKEAGYPVGVYANLNWWNNYLTDSCFDNWHRWVAQYNTSCAYEGNYAMWQYTSSGTIDGIDGTVDMNYLIGSPADHGTSKGEGSSSGQGNANTPGGSGNSGTHITPGTSNTVPMYRMYNPNSGEHFYTGSLEERDGLVKVGWKYEGIAFNAPVSGEPVYRVYNPNSGDHHYTTSKTEIDVLVAAGWKYEGIAWNTASENDIPQYRLWNKNADCGSHHYTGSAEERDWLISLGWVYEGIGWYGTEK